MRRQTSRNPLFRRRSFADDMSILCVRWYLRFKLSYRVMVRSLGNSACSLRRARSCVAWCGMKKTSAGFGAHSKELWEDFWDRFIRSSGSALRILLSRRIFSITTVGALICRSAKTLRNSDEPSLPLKVRSSKFVKSVDCTIITNAGPPNSIEDTPAPDQLFREDPPKPIVICGNASFPATAG
jgi:hypothetical protein